MLSASSLRFKTFIKMEELEHTLLSYKLSRTPLPFLRHHVASFLGTVLPPAADL